MENIITVQFFYQKYGRSCLEEYMDYVFVYGTLMQGMVNHSILEPYITTVRPATIKGRLCHLPQGYPMLFTGAGVVYGELMEIADINQALIVLDELEEYYGPQQAANYYERRRAAVRTSEKSYQAWAYFSPLAAERIMWQRGVPVADGDWHRFIDERG